MESMTYRRKRKEFWMESATTPNFQAKRLTIKEIIRRQARIWRKNRRQFGDTILVIPGNARQNSTRKEHRDGA